MKSAYPASICGVSLAVVCVILCLQLGYGIFNLNPASCGFFAATIIALRILGLIKAISPGI
jgi:hypothetical protein